jgi:uncharacterized membrane protein YhhN
MKQKILLLTGIIAAALYFYGLYTNNHLLRMVTKPIPLFVLMASIKPGSHYNNYIFTGLLLSVIGDVLLETSPSMFLYGLIAFLLAHLAYITAFLKRDRRFEILPLIPILVFGTVVYWFLYSSLQKMAVPVLIYLIVILTMSWRAIAQRNFNKIAVFAATGSIFFVLSDSIIAFNKFYIEIPHAKWIIMFTYWTAQTLIFFSTQDIKENAS